MLNQEEAAFREDNDLAYFLQIRRDGELYSERYTPQLNLPFRAEGLSLWDSWQENDFGLEEGFSVT